MTSKQLGDVPKLTEMIHTALTQSIGTNRLDRAEIEKIISEQLLRFTAKPANVLVTPFSQLSLDDQIRIRARLKMLDQAKGLRYPNEQVENVIGSYGFWLRKLVWTAPVAVLEKLKQQATSYDGNTDWELYYLNLEQHPDAYQIYAVPDDPAKIMKVDLTLQLKYPIKYVEAQFTIERQ